MATSDQAVEVVVEIPKGSRNKYEIDHDTGEVWLDRHLFTATAYPTDYGYVEHTLGEDGDPLDALVLLDEPTFPGCHVNGRPVGVFWMTDEAGPDAKILVVANDTDAAAERFGDRINGTIKGPVDADSLRTAVEEALADVAPDALRARATKVAVAASNALDSLASSNVDISTALGSLAKQLQREDAVAVPAARAIGNGGGVDDIAALVGAMSSGEASLDLKVAAADAAGMILARSGDTEQDVFDALFAVATSDADMALRSAVVRALGKAKVDAATKLKLIDALRVKPASNDG